MLREQYVIQNYEFQDNCHQQNMTPLYNQFQKNAAFYSAAAWIIFGATTNATTCYNQGFSGATSGGSCRVMAYDASAYMAFDAEL